MEQNWFFRIPRETRSWIHNFCYQKLPSYPLTNTKNLPNRSSHFRKYRPQTNIHTSYYFVGLITSYILLGLATLIYNFLNFGYPMDRSWLFKSGLLTFHIWSSFSFLKIFFKFEIPTFIFIWKYWLWALLIEIHYCCLL